MLAEVIMAALILVPPGVAAVVLVLGMVNAARELARVRSLEAAAATPIRDAVGRAVDVDALLRRGGARRVRVCDHRLDLKGLSP